MDHHARKKGAKIFATAFAESFSAALTEATGSKWPFGIAVDGGFTTSDSLPIQFRITVEGGLIGECFVEFYEAHVGTFLAKVTGQPVEVLGEEHKALFAKIVTAAAKGLNDSNLTTYGSIKCRIEPVTGLSFGGMLAVPIATTGTQPEMPAQLYFGAPLLAGLSAPFTGDFAQKADASSAPAYNLNLVMDVELNVSLRFGKRQLPLRDVLDLASGSVIELDRLVDEPVELFLDGKLIARGEAVVVDGNYGLRVTEIPQPLTPQLLN